MPANRRRSSQGPRKVLIAMDRKKHSKEAYKKYLNKYSQEDDQVIMMYCPEHGAFAIPPFPLADSTSSCRFNTEEDDMKKFIAQLKEELKSQGVNGQAILFSDTTPGKAIVKASEKYDVDLIVVGNHGHGFLHKLIRGSVREYVIKHAHVPVLDAC